MNYGDGLLQGLEESWFEDGTLRTKVNYVDGAFHGLYTQWFKDGDRLEEFYKEGKSHGPYKYIRPDDTEWGHKCFQSGEEVDLSVCESE